MMERTHLDALLAPDGLTVVFQPIYHHAAGERRLFGYEALTRGPAGTNLERADVLFEYVRRRGREAVVDRACVAAALRAYTTFQGSATISLNVHAATVESDSGFAEFLAEACRETAVPVTSVILEIVEQQQFSDERRFLDQVSRLRAVGARIALDDVGMAYASVRTMVEVRPDFFKVDAYFVRGSRHSESIRAGMGSIVKLAQHLGGRVIAEGIERVEDLENATLAGADLFQGFLLAQPMTAAAIRAADPDGTTPRHPEK
jgi:EAL domain-containing protein (putative c-di-GMP-specific phosphodiesterase class I)